MRDDLLLYYERELNYLRQLGAEFAEKYHVPFPLLSDSKQETAKAYGVLTSKMGMTYAKRETFLITPDGKIAKRYKDVDPEKNSKQVLADLVELRKTAG